MPLPNNAASFDSRLNAGKKRYGIVPGDRLFDQSPPRLDRLINNSCVTLLQCLLWSRGAEPCAVTVSLERPAVDELRPSHIRRMPDGGGHIDMRAHILPYRYPHRIHAATRASRRTSIGKALHGSFI